MFFIHTDTNVYHLKTSQVLEPPLSLKISTLLCNEGPNEIENINFSKIFCISSIEITPKHKWKISYKYKNPNLEFQAKISLAGKEVLDAFGDLNNSLEEPSYRKFSFMQGR